MARSWTELDRDALMSRYREVRALTQALGLPLSDADATVQSMPDASPAKWHLAHGTWFFETFVLKPFLERYQTPEPRYEVLFNSYYNGIGEQHPRAKRGLLSRPTLDEVRDYRAAVDAGIERLLAQDDHTSRDDIMTRVQLGIEHERQHQELFFTDLKWSLAENPLLPAYTKQHTYRTREPAAQSWHGFEGGLVERDVRHALILGLALSDSDHLAREVEGVHLGDVGCELERERPCSAADVENDVGGREARLRHLELALVRGEVGDGLFGVSLREFVPEGVVFAHGDALIGRSEAKREACLQRELMDRVVVKEEYVRDL